MHIHLLNNKCIILLLFIRHAQCLLKFLVNLPWWALYFMENNGRYHNSKSFPHFFFKSMVLWQKLIQFLQNLEEQEITKSCVKAVATTKSARSQGAQYTGLPSSLPPLDAASQGNAPPSPRKNVCFPDMYLATTYFQGFLCTIFCGGKERSKTKY